MIAKTLCIWIRNYGLQNESVSTNSKII